MFFLLIWYKKNKNMKIFGSKPLLNLALLLGLSSLGTVCLLLPVIAPTSNYSYHDALTIFLFEKTEQVRSAGRQRNRWQNRAGLSINCSNK
jgi:hypothetical protein